MSEGGPRAVGPRAARVGLCPMPESKELGLEERIIQENIPVSGHTADGHR